MAEVGDCDGVCYSVTCSTKELAIRELFKFRNLIIDRYKYMLVFSNGPYDLYTNAIKVLSSENYKDWEDCEINSLYVIEYKVIDK